NPSFLLQEPLEVQASKSKLPPVVLLHGFPDTPNTWKSLKARLSKAGYACYTPWLPGYSSGEDSTGPKSYSNEKFSLANLTKSLSNLISLILSQHTATKVHLIGHDWGSVIAQSYYLQNSPLIQSLTLLAVPPDFLTSIAFHCPRQIRNSLYISFFQLPIIPEFLLRIGGFIPVVLMPAWSPSLHDNAFKKGVTSSLKRGSALSNALGYYRANIALNSILIRTLLILLTPALVAYSYMPKAGARFVCRWGGRPVRSLLALHPLSASFLNLEPSSPRVLLVCGERDGCVCSDMYKRGWGEGGRVTVRMIEGAG
ncbi:hypothetical protein TrRE_jg217, partial [Triparma retinervis]